MSLSRTTLIQIVIIFAIVGGYFFIDFNALMQKIQGEGEFVTQQKECDLHKTACSITLPNNQIYTLEIFPKTIPLMKELQFKVTSNQAINESLHLKIYATNMYMGEFTFTLQKQEDNTYLAKGMLPTCPIGNMQWNAEVTQHNLTKKIGARFQFQTDK